MKEKDIGDQIVGIQTGHHPRCSAYFDSYYFWAETPTNASPSYKIYRDSTEIHSITATNTADQTTYGVLKPFMLIIIRSGVEYLAIVCPYYNSGDADYHCDVYVYDAYNSIHFTYTALDFWNDHHTPLYIFYYSNKLVIPSVEAVSEHVELPYYTWGVNTNGAYVPAIDLSGADQTRNIVGGWANTTGTFYYVISRDGGTYLDSHVVYGGTSEGVKVYKISDTTLVATNSDNYQWLYKHNDTWLFFDNNGGDVYRGKYDIAESFSKIIAGTSCKYGMRMHSALDYKTYGGTDFVGVVQWGTVASPDLGDWTDNSGADCGISIVNKDGHENVLQLLDESAVNSAVAILDIGDLTEGFVEFRIRISDITDGCAIFLYDGVATKRLYIDHNTATNKWRYSSDASGVGDFSAGPTAKTWHKLRIVFNCAANWILYQDGVNIGHISGYLGAPTAMDTFYIQTSGADYNICIDALSFSDDFEGINYEISPNELVGIAKLDGTTLTLYDVFYGGGLEKLPTTVSSVDNIASISNYGFVYYITATWYYREVLFSVYTPTRNELLKMGVFESPTYTIQTASASYQTSLILADDYNNLIFAGHVIDNKDSTELPLKTLIFGSNIKADLEKRHSEIFSAQTDGAILESITDSICVQLTIENGDITSAGSYDHTMNAESIEEFLRWLFARTQKLARWNGVGELVFNAPAIDSGLAITKDNIISEFYIQQETGKYGMVILEAPGIRVQSPIEDGGDGIYYDFYPNVNNETELQSMADNIATMQHNQFEKITVAVDSTGLLKLAEYASVVYAPNERISVNGDYYIMGFEYIPYANSSLLKLSNAIFVESIMDKDPVARQTKVNTQKINNRKWKWRDNTEADYDDDGAVGTALTDNTSYNTIDLSAMVGKKTMQIKLYGKATDNVTGSKICVRTKGFVGDVSNCVIFSKNASQQSRGNWHGETDSLGRIEIKCSPKPTDWTQIDIYVKAYKDA